MIGGLYEVSASPMKGMCNGDGTPCAGAGFRIWPGESELLAIQKSCGQNIVIGTVVLEQSCEFHCRSRCHAQKPS